MYKREKPLVSIVIPSWFTNDQHGKYCQNETYWFAQECLKRLINVTPKNLYELIVIDNGSTITGTTQIDDKTIPVAEYWSMADVLIRNNENLGFGPACNQGFSVSRGEYVCCLNNDILVWSNWLDAILATFKLELQPAPGIVMPALMRETKDAREALNIKTINLDKNKNSYGSKAEFGSLWIAPKWLLNKVAERRGGYYVFDEEFLCGMGEDRLLYREIRELGYETYRTHNTRVFHQGNMSIGKIKNRKDFTVPNREYLKRLTNLERQGQILTIGQRSELRKRVEEEFSHGNDFTN